MASQMEKDVAKAVAKTQIDIAKTQGQTSYANAQTQADTERARARTQADTARARSRQNGGDGGTNERMSQRETATGLSNNTSNRNNLVVTMEESSVYPNEFEADFKRNLGLNDPFYIFERDVLSEEIVDHGVHDNTNDTLPSPVSSISVVMCVNGNPFSASVQGIIGNEITT